jgi:protein gp37
MGATATDQASWDVACAHLRQIPPGFGRWISVEPLLAPIVIGDWVPDWVVVGLLSPRPVLYSREWAHLLADALRARGVPVYGKTSVPEIGREWPRGVGA